MSIFTCDTCCFKDTTRCLELEDILCPLLEDDCEVEEQWGPYVRNWCPRNLTRRLGRQANRKPSKKALNREVLRNAALRDGLHNVQLRAKVML